MINAIYFEFIGPFLSRPERSASIRTCSSTVLEVTARIQETEGKEERRKDSVKNKEKKEGKRRQRKRKRGTKEKKEKG